MMKRKVTVARALDRICSSILLLLAVLSLKVVIRIKSLPARTIQSNTESSTSGSSGDGVSSSSFSKLEAQQQTNRVRSQIPHRIIFTYKTNILQTKEPTHYYQNVQHTITKYRELWNEPDAPVEFLDDETCQHYIESVYPKLVPHFQQETHGAYKADICRVAALYLHGGYYFDVDIRVVEPVVLADNVTFSTAVSSTGIFFQAWLATTPQHPVLWQAFEEMLAHYERRKSFGTIMGCRALTNAYAAVEKVNQGEYLMLEEIDLQFKRNLYKDLPRQSGSWILCNYVVHDANTQKVHFFSRIVGSSNCPMPILNWNGTMLRSAITSPMA